MSNFLPKYEEFVYALPAPLGSAYHMAYEVACHGVPHRMDESEIRHFTEYLFRQNLFPVPILNSRVDGFRQVNGDILLVYPSRPKPEDTWIQVQYVIFVLQSRQIKTLVEQQRR